MLLIVLVGRWEQAWLLAIVCSMVVEDVFGCCLGVFGAHPAFSLVLVCGGFDGRLPMTDKL